VEGLRDAGEAVVAENFLVHDALKQMGVAGRPATLSSFR